MPKEYIYDNYKVYNETSGEDELLNTNKVKLTWNRDAGYVQIATVNPEGEEIVSAGVDENGVYSEDERRKVEGGWHVDLDRRNINQLIRILRRARDQAFGRDE